MTHSDHPLPRSADRHTAPRRVRAAVAPAQSDPLPITDGQPRRDRVVPPVVYLPVSPDSPPDDPLVEFRRLGSGEVALLAYTALDRLAEGLGEHQPWLLVETARLDELDRESPYDVIVLDRVVPVELRHGAPS